jgi:hypothetical protein
MARDKFNVVRHICRNLVLCVTFFLGNMVDNVVPLFSQEQRMLRSDGALNRAFFFTLFKDHAMAIEFVKDIGLIRRTMHCNSCKQDMTWSGRPDINDIFHWRCQWRVAGSRCNIACVSVNCPQHVLHINASPQ